MRIRSSREVGVLIRERRRAAGLSQTGLAQRIGASRNWVSAMERGKRTAELELVLRALGALGLSINVLDRSSRTGATEGELGETEAAVRRSGVLRGPPLTSGGKPLGPVRSLGTDE